MPKRHLKRQLNLVQVIMLGTAGTIAAEIFVLTGHAAGIAGPDAVIALLIGGFLTYSVALNYCELATTYPVTGGAMTYVREAFGTNLLMFLVGSLDCLSSTFYAALSAIGFAYSLQVFFPVIPIVPVAIGVIGLFTLLHVRGVYQVGNLQVAFGGFLLLVFALFIVLGLTRSSGFQWEVFRSGRVLFENQSRWANLARVMATIALVYNAYVGFEVIADDAEEVTNPNRNIPIGILVSLTLATLIYSLVAFITIGTVPFQQLAGSETALTDAAQRFWPAAGVPLMALAGIVATLTSVNSAILSATREAFSLSRFGVWPRPLSRLSSWRTPYISIVLIGIISALVAAIGLVDFLSYISSAGYLFVLFWASLAMVKLRKLHPDVLRPFKVPFFPFSAYAAAGSGFLIIAFTKPQALLFLGGVVVVLGGFYFGGQFVSRQRIKRIQLLEENETGRFLIPVANPETAESLVRLAVILAQVHADDNICVYTVVRSSDLLAPGAAERVAHHLNMRRNVLLERTAPFALAHNVGLYTKRRVSSNLAESILKESADHGNVRMILMGWPGQLKGEQLAHNVVKEVLMAAHTNVGVFCNRGLKDIRRILVPVGGGPHSRFCLRLAYQIAGQEKANVTALRTINSINDIENTEDQLLFLQEIIEDELGSIPKRIISSVVQAENVVEGILQEAHRQPYDLIILGASEEYFSTSYLFGRINDQIVENSTCSVLMVRRYEREAFSWMRRQIKRIGRENLALEAIKKNGNSF